MGLTADPTISLIGRGVQGMGVLALRRTSLQAGSLSFCSGDTLVTDTLRNLGCDTLVLTGLHLNGDTAFSLVSVPDSLLLPGDSAIVTIQFGPRLKGPHTATLTFHERNIVNDPGHDTTVTISGFGLGGPTALSADTTTRNFGALFECESRDTTLWLTNPGCDTLMVDTAMLSTAGLALDTTFPLILPGDSSVPVHISLISSISPNPGSDTGSVTFYSNANTGKPTARIPLVATIIQPMKLTLGLTPAASAHAGQMVTIYVILTGDTGAAASELKGVQFVLTHNDDLLELKNAVGLTWSPGSGNITRTDTFEWLHGSRSSAYTDTIGTLTFQVYLTDSSATPLALSDISFQGPPNIPIDCIASVDSNASAFQYLYHCGDLTIQQALEHQPPFSIVSVVPNPAGAALRVQGRGYRVQGLDVQLFDALGNCVITEYDPIPYTLNPTPYTHPLDVSSLPSGIYFLRVSNGGYAESRSVAIRR